MTLTSNPDYLLSLYCDDPFLQIIANIPENLMMATGSEWEPRMAGSLRSFISNTGGILGQGASAALWASNLDLVVQSLTYQVWQSSAPIEMNLTLLFDANTDPYLDVVKPMSDLQAFALPYSIEENSDILLSPGPSVVEPNRSRLSVRLGRFIYINSVVLINVSNTFDTRFHNGQPISGQSEVTFRTINTPSRQEVTSFHVANAGYNTNYGTETLFSNVGGEGSGGGSTNPNTPNNSITGISV